MKKIIVILLMLSIFNQSVDIDYLLTDTNANIASKTYDDIDSIAEYVLEKIFGNDHLISEEDDDSGNPINKSFEKDYNDIAWYFSTIKFCPTVLVIPTITTWPKGLDLANRTCKGYFNITSPPPDFIA